MSEPPAVWARPYFKPSTERAWLDLVVFTRDKPALDVDLGEEDGFPPDYEFPRTISVRATALAEHRDVFEQYLEGPFRDLATEQIGEAAAGIDQARYAVSIEGSIGDPRDLAHAQAIRAFERFLGRTAGGIAIANDLSLAWQDLRAMTAAEPQGRLRIEEWIEVLYDDEVRGIHTRGMAQFARPDIALFDQPEHRLERAAQLLRHIAHLEAHGTLYGERSTLEVEGPSSAALARVTVGLSRLDEDRCKALAVRPGTLVVEGWPSGIA